MRDEKLKTALKKCIELLENYKEEFWSKKLNDILNKLIETGMSSDLGSDILILYGGMGSFSDLVIMEVNGYDIKENEEDNANEELENLREQIYECAKKNG
jgi:hypothetical protein